MATRFSFGTFATHVYVCAACRASKCLFGGSSTPVKIPTRFFPWREDTRPSYLDLETLINNGGLTRLKRTNRPINRYCLGTRSMQGLGEVV